MKATQNRCLLSGVFILLSVNESRLLMKSFILLTGTVYCLLTCQPLAAQPTDSLPGYKEAVSVYHSLLTPETGLYKGKEYIDYSYNIQEGSAFFDTVPFSVGSVVYHHVLYQNLLMAYDIVQEKVVIYDQPRLHTLSLINDEVSGFSKDGHPFTHLTKDSTGASRMREGFYQLLYAGNIRVLKKETRTVLEAIAAQGTLKNSVIGVTDYFVEKEGVYYPVRNKSLLLSVLKDKSRQVQAFIRKQKLKFRRNKDSDFAQAGAYYDTLTK